MKKRILICVILLLLTLACAAGAIFIFQKTPMQTNVPENSRAISKEEETKQIAEKVKVFIEKENYEIGRYTFLCTFTNDLGEEEQRKVTCIIEDSMGLEVATKEEYIDSSGTGYVPDELKQQELENKRAVPAPKTNDETNNVIPEGEMLFYTIILLMVDTILIAWYRKK